MDHTKKITVLEGDRRVVKKVSIREFKIIEGKTPSEMIHSRKKND